MSPREIFIPTFGLCLLAALLAADAQPAQPARIGYLANTMPVQFDGFREGMRELGHVEGQTYTIDARLGKIERYPNLAADLVRSRVDLILAVGQAARAAKAATATIPIVFLGGDPVAEGLVASFHQAAGLRPHAVVVDGREPVPGARGDLSGRRGRPLCGSSASPSA